MLLVQELLAELERLTLQAPGSEAERGVESPRGKLAGDDAKLDLGQTGKPAGAGERLSEEGAAQAPPPGLRDDVHPGDRRLVSLFFSRLTGEADDAQQRAALVERAEEEAVRGGQAAAEARDRDVERTRGLVGVGAAERVGVVAQALQPHLAVRHGIGLGEWADRDGTRLRGRHQDDRVARADVCPRTRRWPLSASWRRKRSSRLSRSSPVISEMRRKR